MQCSPLYTLCLFSIPSNVHILDIEYSQGMCSPIFIADDFVGLLLYTSIFSIEDSKSA